MTLNSATSKEYEDILDLIENLYPGHFNRTNVKAVYLKKLNDADIISQNKAPNIKGKTSHIAVTTFSINFFKEILGAAYVETRGEHKYFSVFVDSNYSDTSTSDAFVSTKCAIWVNPKEDSPQIGLSRIDGDGEEFINLRKELYKGDLLLFFKYLEDNKVNYYALAINKDNPLLENLSFNTNSKVLIKYYEQILNDYYFDSNPDLIGFNKIYYGAPGSGKSHEVRRLYENEYSQRILFHNDYQYADFVGHIKPILVKEAEKTRLLYKFENGPFTDILIRSLKDRDNMYTLIIEEINRANAPSVFGDLFQLLDRKESGESEYSIYNIDIYNQIKENLKDDYDFSEGTIFLPNNLTIVATMNNSDQNTVVLDTAFKRRWEYHYVPINFKNHMYKDNPIDQLNVSWYDFVTSINGFMFDDMNLDLMLTEDKQIGQYFARKRDLENFSLFAYKVLLYLWDDVFKYNRDRIFRNDIYTFDKLLEEGRVKGIEIFTPELATVLAQKRIEKV